MNKPQRIQRRSDRGFKLPPNTVCVTRGTKWGNPFAVVGHDGVFAVLGEVRGEAYCFGPFIDRADAANQAVELFDEKILANIDGVAEAIADLRGKNLACFCPIGQPCHADLLLEICSEPQP